VRRDPLAGWLLVTVVVLAVLGPVLGIPLAPAAGILGWIACALLLPRLASRQIAIALVLAGVGAAGIAWGMAAGVPGLIERALAQNIPLMGMLIAVSFLRLISVSPTAANEPLQTGRYALLRTLIGVHLFGAVINFSAVAIFADRLAARAKLTLEQILGLTQAFMIGSLWSPFFGAMAVALTAAPEASLPRLIAIGLPIAIAGLLITWLTLSSKRYGHARDFAGYPVHFEALWVPAVLAAGVLTVHEWQPGWPVLAVIAALAPLVTVATLLSRDGPRAWEEMRRLIELRLPEMGGETSLFLAAGVVSAGMAGVIAALDLHVPFDSFGGLEATAVFVGINAIAWLGLHPVIVISAISPWLAPAHPDPTLLAMVFLMNWGTGLPACPMANTLIALQGRYGIPYRTVLARNRVFSAQLTVLCIVVINVYARYAL
jgi:hypothetical protein